MGKRGRGTEENEDKKNIRVGKNQVIGTEHTPVIFIDRLGQIAAAKRVAGNNNVWWARELIHCDPAVDRQYNYILDLK